jgi:hypothetical protein
MEKRSHDKEKKDLLVLMAAAFFVVVTSASCFQNFNGAPISPMLSDERSTRTAMTPRERLLVAEIFNEAGPYYQKQYYRMDAGSFYRLYLILSPFMRFRVERAATASAPKQRIGALDRQLHSEDKTNR